jgi:uncharacterized membrane protein YGL010W
MKELATWLSEYGESHQNRTNKRIHFICVPLIFWSIYFMIYSIPFPENKSAYINIANLVYFFALIFWVRLSIKLGIIFLAHGLILAFLAPQLLDIVFLGSKEKLFIGAFIVFILAWIGQFYGHKIEGKKPSFLKDLQFLLIGPAWIIHDFFMKKNGRI